MWKIEKSFIIDRVTQQMQENPPSLEDLYMEFTADGRSCSGWAGARCDNYEDTYTVTGDIINIKQLSVTGTAFRYRWKIVGNKLELVAEAPIDGHWTPMLKYILVKVR